MTQLLGADDPGLAPRADLADAVAELTAYAAPDEEQRQTRDRMMAFLGAHPDGLWRSCTDGHLTGSALVVDAEAERVLVLFHAKVRRWLQPGGHVDGDANLAAVARREATEETGIAGLRVVRPLIDLDVHVFHSAGEADHLHLDARFLVLAPADAVVRGNHESEGLRWVALDELPGLDADPGTVRMATRGLALARHLRTGEPA
ncbi:MAG TPA: NUDIX hydrolase [Acidimicrobiales bacterium]